MLAITVHGQLEDLRAFVVAIAPALEGPGLQIGRGVKGDPARLVALVIYGHDPMLFRLVPDHLGIAAAVFDHGIAREIRKGPAAIIAEGDRLSAATPTP